MFQFVRGIKLPVFYLLLALVGVHTLQHADAEVPPVLTSRSKLDLAIVKKIVAAAEAEARSNQWKVSIAVVDDAGQLIHAIRMDDTPVSSLPIALAKAKHANNYRRDTRFHQELLAKGNMLVLTLPDSMPIAGGVVLRHNGQVIGGIGVSGVQADQDEQIARAGASLL